MLEVVPVVFVDSLSVEEQLVKVVDVLLDDVGYIFQLRQFMPIMLSKHALRADNGVAYFAEVLYLLVLMFEAEDFTRLGIGNCSSSSACVADSVV